jgi:hypothetical protein
MSSSAYCNDGSHIWRMRGHEKTLCPDCLRIHQRAWCDDCRKFQKFEVSVNK